MNRGGGVRGVDCFVVRSYPIVSTILTSLVVPKEKEIKE